MAHFLLTTHWTGGDVYPFIRFGRILKAAGHRVTLVTHAHYEQKARQANLDFAAIDTLADWQHFLTQHTTQIAQSLAVETGALQVKKLVEDQAETLFDYDQIEREVRLINRLCDSQTVIVGRFKSSLAGLLSAEINNLPFINLFMAPALLMQARLDEAMLGKTLLRDLNVIRGQFNLRPVENWLRWATSPPLALGFWPVWFAVPDKSWPTDVKPIGFAIETGATSRELPAEVANMLAEQQPILITGGTGKILHPAFYEQAATACGATAHPTLLVTQHDEFRPKSLPTNVVHYDYLPFEKLMPHCSLVINHGGIGTAAQALKAGVPQLILPVGLDRPDNAYRFKQLGVADSHLPATWDVGPLVKSIHNLMQPGVKAQCQKYAVQMDPNSFGETMLETLGAVAENPDDYRPNLTPSHQPQPIKKRSPKRSLSSLSPAARQKMMQKFRQKSI